jgi:hypothetical protein
VLRERVEKGESADVFASADMGHPLKLLAEGRDDSGVVRRQSRSAGFGGAAEDAGENPGVRNR